MTTRLRRGADLTDDEIRTLWRFRLSMFSLKPDVDPEADWQWFRGVLRAADHVWHCFDDQARLVGFSEARTVSRVIQGRKLQVAIGTFVFLEPAWRGHPRFLWVLLRSTLRQVLTSIFMPVFATVVAYPTVWMLYCRQGGRPVVDGEAPPGSLEAAVLAAMRAEVAGFEGETPQPVVSLNTLPAVPGPEWFARLGQDPWLAHYLEINPRWSEGYGVYAVGRVNLAFLGRMLKKILRRNQRLKEAHEGRAPSPP